MYELGFFLNQGKHYKNMYLCLFDLKVKRYQKYLHLEEL